MRNIKFIIEIKISQIQCVTLYKNFKTIPPIGLLRMSSDIDNVNFLSLQKPRIRIDTWYKLSLIL
jgi:hypothetical protein